MKRLALAILVVLSLAVAGNAQTFRGSINGTVTDPSGGVVPNATVKATESATGIDHTTTTTSDGAFSFQDIPLGLYKVTVTATGFPAYTVDKVEVSAGQIYTLAVKLSLQQQATTVEVSAAALTLDTTTQTQNMTIASDIVQDVPLNGRDFTQLIGIAPGFGGYAAGGFGSVNGTRANQVNWQIDGVDNNDFWHNVPAVNQGGVSGIAGVVMPVDAIDEFSAQTQSGSEGGRSAGGTVNVVIKSGGNQVHGSLYYYNRNEAFGSPSPFFVASPGTKKPPVRNENYGFTVGGPIIKNKAFFFVGYEKQDYFIGLSGLATEPSDLWVALAQDLLNNPGGKYGSYAPVSASTLSQNLIGPNGLWPRSGVGSIAGLSATNNNYFSPIAATGYSYNGVAKIDYNITDKHHLYLRWYGGQGSQTQPLGGSAALGTASSNLKDYFEVAPLHVFNYSAVLNSTLTPKLTNQVLFGANYFNQIFHDFGNGFNTKTLGLFLSPDATNHGQYILGAPNLQISGFENIGLTPPEGRSDLTWHITDVISQSLGKHQFRYGGEIRQAHLNEFYHRRGLGSFTFDGSRGPWSGLTGCGAATPTAACAALVTTNPTTNVLANAEALADYMAGDVVSSTIAVGDPERWVKVNALNFYFQDAWQVSTKLNLNFGLRYEYFGPLHSDKKDIANFIPGTGFVVQDSSHPLFNPGKDHFAPRFGFAYQPTAKGDLVVRGSFGVFYDQINLNPFLDFRPAIAASQGIQGNAFGAAPVSTWQTDFCGSTAYNWSAVQVPGQVCPAGTPNAGQVNTAGSVFPGVKACSDPNCAAAGDPKGLSAYAVSQNFRTPYYFNYSLQVEKSFGSAAIFQIGYVGSEGRKLNIVSNINQNGAFPNFGNILQLNTIGTSNYNSLQTTFRLRSWHGLTSTFGYTWAHALDEITAYRTPVLDDAFNKRLDYGNSDFDTRHLFTADYSYDVPKAPWATSGWSKQVFNNWHLSSLWVFHTGQPSDEVRMGLDLIGDPYAGITHNFSAGVQWWNPSAFAVPTGGPVCPNTQTGLCGNLSRNKLYGPGYVDVDFSVFKNIPITERLKIQLRAEWYNLTNRINLANGTTAVSSTCGATAPGAHCTSGFGFVSDTAGDFFGAPGIGPGEARGLVLVGKIIF
jgi:hypothetical protein